MNKKYLLVIGLMLGLVVSSSALAQTGTPPPDPEDKVRPIVRNVKKETKDDRIENRKEIKDLRLEQKGKIKDLRIGDEGDRKDLTREQREVNKDEVKLKRDEIKKEMEKKRMELKNEQHQKMQVRFDAMVNRFDKMADRIQSRIDKLTSEGKDTTVAQGLLNEAKDLITQVDAKADATVIAQGGDESTRLANKKALDEIKALMKQVQDKLHEALKALK